jgi:MmgE/PrpD N-terminal domain
VARPTSPLAGLAERLLSLRLEELDASDAMRLDAAIRTSHLAVGIGSAVERAVALVPPEAVCKAITPASDLYAAMTSSYFEALLGAATDLDALDRGPAHCALPSVVAASVASSVASGTSEAIGRAVLAGIEAGSRLRAAVEGRPGSGFHSVGVFGTFAAAAAAATALQLDATEYANALGIALTRAAGLSQNSAATGVGLTHFGWAAAHGLEAAWLARLGATASLDVETALHTFYPDSTVIADFDDAAPRGLKRLFFKRYPCNVYLNLIVLALADGSASGADAIRIEMPAVRHLDSPRPVDVRQARNSAQAVAAVAVLGDPSYSSFSRAPGLGHGSDSQREPTLAVEVEMDPTAATGLESTAVRVTASRRGAVVADRTVPAMELGPWDLAHARRLVRDLPLDDWIGRVYESDYRASRDWALDRVLNPSLVEVS